jgi:HAD superfamily hydrolase (TIGR01490 family)
MATQPRIAFYDFDGTLTSGNVVRRYAFFCWRQPSRWRAAAKFSKLVLGVPAWMALDLYSRRRFNEVFYREYRGFSEKWLRRQSERLFEELVRPSLYPGAKGLIERDRAEGYRPVLVSGELDFALERVVRYLGFDGAICNSLLFRDGIATGEVAPPLIAEEEKVAAMRRYAGENGAALEGAKAYSDSFSDLPMLEAVGHPTAVNPDRRLRRVARARGWPALNLRGDARHSLH